MRRTSREGRSRSRPFPSAIVAPLRVLGVGQMRRRQFLGMLGGAAVAWPLAVRAQQVSTRRPLVAVLSAVTRERNLPLNAFVQGMREFGYVEGQNIDIEYRFAEGRLERFPALAEELVRVSPNVIVAAVTPAASQQKR